MRRRHRHHGRRRRGRGPRRLFLRLYLYGLVLLAAVAASLGVFGALTWSGPPWVNAERIARYFDEELSPLVDRPAELRVKLDRLHTLFEVDVAVYRPNGELVAKAGDAPGPPQEPPSKPYMRGDRGGHEYGLPLQNGAAFAVARMRWRSGGGPRFLLAAAIVLGVLALVSLPVARGIARPIERITGAARALGAGDLSARTGICRGDEVGDLARAFDDMASRLEHLVQSEKELLANVSHELRTPLARIRVALELVEEGGGSGAKLREHLRGIGGDLRELEHLVEQVLLTARLDLKSVDMRLERTSVRMSDLVADAVERFRTLHPKHRAQADVQPELPEVDADAALLRRVLDNLLDNAAKYTPEDNGPILVDVSYDGADAPIIVSVRDRGIGVDEAAVPRLFEPFFRSDRSRERGTGGVGLGLALCRRIVAAHGGTIEAHVPRDGGLEVRFTVPLAA